MPKIYVSPSSQEANIYTSGQTEEHVMNLLADILIPELVRHGIEVMRNRKENTFNGHVAESNVYKPDLHLAIHSNAMGAGMAGKARGCEVFCYDPTNTASLGTKLAQKIYSRLSALTPSADRGVKSGKDTISEIRNTHAPAVLMEVAFHDNVDDSKWIISNLPQMAEAILLACLEQFQIKYIPLTPPVADEVFEAEINRLMEKLDWHEKKMAEIRKVLDAPFKSSIVPK